ncbi:MAG: glycerate kinase [Alphaproteobacteria bacterium]|nr:MAG: glycerate kinase [Alphaproteobacteria bacterium]
MNNPRPFLESLFRAAIAAAQPSLCLPAHLPQVPEGRTLVFGAGKASAAMAKAVEDNWPGDLRGLVVTRHGYETPCSRIEIVRAAHPVPDDAGLNAARRMLEMAGGLTEKDLVLCLVSGGGSALLPLPMPGLTLAEKQDISRSLLKCGAAIGEMNCVRRHLSSIKGGRLAAACFPAKVVTLLISDVPGDNPMDIASGPTVADTTTCADALSILEKYKIGVPSSVRKALADGTAESVKPGDPRLENGIVKLIATPRMALEKAAALAEANGVRPHILGDALEGEARKLGRDMASLAEEARFKPPCVLLSGGETTVTVTGNGRGGRNVEFLLSLGLALKGRGRVYALAGDTDGVDGMEEIAGAYLAPDSLARARAAGIDPAASLANNDGHGFFQSLGDSIVTGPTLTNVNDFRAVLLDDAPG